MKKQCYQVKSSPLPPPPPFFSFAKTSVNPYIYRTPGCADALNSTAGVLAVVGVFSNNQIVKYNVSAVVNRAITSKRIWSADSSDSNEPCTSQTREHQVKESYFQGKFIFLLVSQQTL